MFEKQIENGSRYKYKCTAKFRSGFWQQGLTDRAKALTAFIKPSQRILCWKVLPFGVTVAPEAFQEATNHFVYLVSKKPAVRKLLDRDKCGVEVAIDDLTIAAETEEDVLIILKPYSRFAGSGAYSSTWRNILSWSKKWSF